MLTNLDLNFKVTKSQPGYVVGDWKMIIKTMRKYTPGIDERVHPGDKIPVRVPYFMADVPEEDTIDTIKSPSNIFINAKECRPVNKRMVKSLSNVIMQCETNQEYITLYDGDRVNCDFHAESLYKYTFNTNERRGVKWYTQH